MIAQRHPGIHPLLQQRDSLIDFPGSLEPGFDHETNGRDLIRRERIQNRCRHPLRFGQEGRSHLG